MKNLIWILAALASESFGCSPKELRKLDNFYSGLENQTYIERRENEPTVYRGIATTRGEAFEMAFKDLKNKKCPDKIRY